MTKQVVIIGSGFAGLAAAATLAQQARLESKDIKVKVIEKNATIGGRARKFSESGFTFDMGPSWYWMPEIFENFYNKFNYTTADFYNLVRLDPSYTVVFDNEVVHVPAKFEELLRLFESFEEGSAYKLKAFLDESKVKYEAGMNTYVWKPGNSLLEYANLEVLSSMFKLQMLSSVSTQVRKLFRDPRIIKILEFPVLFLGAKPANTPALYTLMNYADIALGTWYPMGGMNKIIEAFQHICQEQGVEFCLESEIKSFEYNTNNQIISCLDIHGNSHKTDYLIGSADYHHIDSKLLRPDLANYSQKYWKKRKMAPSSLLFYIGLDSKIPNLHHHTLFFDKDFDTHADEIYQNPQWPSDPLFYVCAPSVTDSSVAPTDCENLFILVPIAPDLKDEKSTHDHYLNIISQRFQHYFHINIQDSIKFIKYFSVEDFKSEYNSFKGNAYGLANTLDQTGPLKPKMRNRHISNLYYAGQLTVPGPGVPPSIISGQLVANEILKSI